MRTEKKKTQYTSRHWWKQWFIIHVHLSNQWSRKTTVDGSSHDDRLLLPSGQNNVPTTDWVKYDWSGRGIRGKYLHSLKIHKEMEKLWMAQEGRNYLDQCLLFGELNLALPHTPSHKPGLPVSFIKICDRPDVVAAVKKSLSGCSGGMKSPGEGWA